MSNWSSLFKIFISPESSSLANVTRELDKQIRQGAKHLAAAKRNLAHLTSEQCQLSSRITGCEETIANYEKYILKALDQDNEMLARELAAKIVDLEKTIKPLEVDHAELEAKRLYCTTSVDQLYREQKRTQQQAEMIQATESVRRAKAVIDERQRKKRTQTPVPVITKFDPFDEDKIKDALLTKKLIAAGIIKPEQEITRKLEEVRHKHR